MAEGVEPARPTRVLQSTKQLPAGTRLEHFEILEPFAAGGMGTVYRAMDHSAKRVVALKVLRAEFASDEDYVRMFEDEACSLARLNHPNIIPIYFSARHGKWLYFAMPLIDGRNSLEMVRQSGQCDPAAVRRWAMQVVSALAMAWRQGVLHRDLKPANILIEAGTGNALLADFGLALVRGFEGSEVAEEWGSPAYLSPEQIRREALDFRSDMYSFGATLFHLLAGQTPYASENWRDQIDGHLNRPFPYHVAEVRGIPPVWTSILARMMEKRPEDRYPSYEALAEALRDMDRPAAPRRVVTEAWEPVPQAAGWRAERLNGLVRESVAFWAGFETGGVNTMRDSGVSVGHLPSLVSLSPWQWHIRQICEGGEGDATQLREFAMIIPEYGVLLDRLAATGWYAEGGDGKEGFELALARTGLARARVLAVSCVFLYESIRVSKTFDWLPLWRHGMSCGLLAELLLAFFGFPEEPQAFAAGFFHDVGKVILGDIAAMGVLVALRRSLHESIPLRQCEEECLPMGHVAAGRDWARAMDLPGAVVDAIGLHHADVPRRHGPVVAAVQAANELCKRHCLGYSGEGVLENSRLEDNPGLRWLIQHGERGTEAAGDFQTQLLPQVGRVPLLGSQEVDPRSVLQGEETQHEYWRMT